MQENNALYQNILAEQNFISKMQQKNPLFLRQKYNFPLQNNARKQYFISKQCKKQCFYF